MIGRYDKPKRLAAAFAACWLLIGATLGAAIHAAEPTVYPQTAYAPVPLPTAWQAPVVAQGDEQLMAVDTGEAVQPVALLDRLPASQSLAPGCPEGACNSCRSTNGLFGCQSDDFMWGCGGWPFQTGPGCCDTWKVGPVWDVSVDGLVLSRKNANLTAITAQAAFDSQGDPLVDPIPILANQFDYGGGARVFAAGTLPQCAGYRLQFGYEGVPEWNASVVFPEVTPIPVAGSPADSSEQRRVHLTSVMHSAEFNFDRRIRSGWQPYAGIRYLRFNDRLSDLIDQEAPDPLPAVDPATVTTTDTLNLFDLDNQLVGFQVGMRRDLWQICRRFTLQGYANSGLYYNWVKRTNLRSVSTRQATGYDTDEDIAASVNVANATNNDVAALTDVAYMAEASLTGVCRLNKCLALRGGYQLLWIDGLRLAENAYLGEGLPERRLTFQGWHVGLEYRR